MAVTNLYHTFSGGLAVILFGNSWQIYWKNIFGSKKTMSCDAELYEKVLGVVQEAAKGNLEPRVVNIDTNKPMGKVALGINDLLDQVEALLQ